MFEAAVEDAPDNVVSEETSPCQELRKGASLAALKELEKTFCFRAESPPSQTGYLKLVKLLTQTDIRPPQVVNNAIEPPNAIEQ